jgi:intraflagellar transport protein 88
LGDFLANSSGHPVSGVRQVALDNDASCVEALYNLGLCHKQLKRYEDSLEIFFKLQSIVRNHPEVMYQIANVYELVGDIDQVLLKTFFLN